MATEENSMQPGHYVQANGLEIYYEEVGAGAPLLLHGGTLTSSSWRAHGLAFAQHYRVIMPDSRGHGRTKNPTGALSYRLMADDMVAFVQALGLDKPLICGFSDGGQIALEVGMRYPALAKALVVIGASYKISEQARNTVRGWGIAGPGVVDLEQVQKTLPGAVKQWQTEHAPLGGPDAWQTLLCQISTLWWTPLAYTEQELQQITAPTLIMVGDRDEFMPAEEAAETYRFIPQAELAILPHTTHGGAVSGASGVNPLFMDIVSDFFLRYNTQGE